MPEQFTDREGVVLVALEELGAVAAGQPAEAEDRDRVDAAVDGLFAELRVRSVVDVDDEDEIPKEWERSLGLLLADEVCVAFGRSKMGDAARSSLEKRLRSTVKADATGEVQRAEYF